MVYPVTQRPTTTQSHLPFLPSFQEVSSKEPPEAVKKKLAHPGARGRGTLAKEKPPILGLVQRGGGVVLRMLENVQQQTIAPIIRACVTEGARFYTDEYDIYNRLPEWGYEHRSVGHSRGEYARDEDGDGLHEIHVNTMEGIGSLLRS